MIKAISHSSTILKPDGIKRVQDHYGAWYVASFALPDHMFKDVFYVPEPDFSKGHNHYFGILRRMGSEVAITGMNHRITESIYVSLAGIICEDTFYYSGDRHDMVMAPDGQWIDGGLHYTRTATGCLQHLVLADAGPTFDTGYSSHSMIGVRHKFVGYL